MLLKGVPEDRLLIHALPKCQRSSQSLVRLLNFNAARCRSLLSHLEGITSWRVLDGLHIYSRYSSTDCCLAGLSS
jgi:hypothetical protein